MKSLISNIELKDEEGQTPLIIAVCNRQLDVINLLLSHGAQINAVDNEGKTALIHAITPGGDSGDPADDLVKLLIEKKADIEVKNERGKTALFFGKSISFKS